MATAVRAACRLQPILKNFAAVNPYQCLVFSKSCENNLCRQFSVFTSLLTERKYTDDHEWVLREGTSSNVTVGITDYAQNSLGDIVFVELPEVGSKHDKAGPVGTIESVKAVSDVFSPVGGEITEINQALEGAPEVVNASPLEDGWLFKMLVDDVSSLDELMTEKQYEEFIEGQQ